MFSQVLAHLFYVLIYKGGYTMAFLTTAFAIDWLLLISIYNLFLYLAILALFKIKNKVLLGVGLGLIFLGVVVFFASYDYGEIFGLHSGFLFTVFVSIIISWKAYRAGNRQALIIATGFGIYLMVYTAFILFYGGWITDIRTGIFAWYSLMDSLYFISIISIPFCLSLL